MQKIVVSFLVIGGFLALSVYSPIVLNKIYLFDELNHSGVISWLYIIFLKTPAFAMVVLGAMAYACLMQLVLQRFSKEGDFASSKHDFLRHSRSGVIYACFWNLLAVFSSISMAMPLSAEKESAVICFLFSTFWASLTMHMSLSIALECVKKRSVSQNTQIRG